MSQAILNQILDQLPTLDKSELQHLSQAIQGYLSDPETVTKRAAFHQALVKSGLVRKTHRGNPSISSCKDRADSP